MVQPSLGPSPWRSPFESRAAEQTALVQGPKPLLPDAATPTRVVFHLLTTLSSEHRILGPEGGEKNGCGHYREQVANTYAACSSAERKRNQTKR